MQTIKFYYYWYSGLLRLAGGFCPSCNSSPPLRECLVCGGDQDYWRGNANWTAEKGLIWKAKYRRGLELEFLS